MGYRLHSQKMHVIKYSDAAHLNYQVDAFDAMVTEFCPDRWTNGDAFGNCPTEYEIDKEDFTNMISKIKGMTQEEFDAYDFGFDKEVTVDYLVDVLESLLKEADPNLDVIYLTWF